MTATLTQPVPDAWVGNELLCVIDWNKYVHERVLRLSSCSSPLVRPPTHPPRLPLLLSSKQSARGALEQLGIQFFALLSPFYRYRTERKSIAMVRSQFKVGDTVGLWVAEDEKDCRVSGVTKAALNGAMQAWEVLRKSKKGCRTAGKIVQVHGKKSAAFQVELMTHFGLQVLGCCGGNEKHTSIPFPSCHSHSPPLSPTLLHPRIRSRLPSTFRPSSSALTLYPCSSPSSSCDLCR